MVPSQSKVCLIVIDGWGISSQADDRVTVNSDGQVLQLPSDAIRAAKTPVMDRLTAQHASTQLVAHGLAVGLPEGLMGNSEVGHLNIGAGRVVYQDIVRIDLSIKEGSMENNSVLQAAFSEAKKSTGRLHLVGLVSDGGVHSHMNHLFALLEYAKRAQIPQTFIHAITDGRDTAPTSAKGYLQHLLQKLQELQYGKLATIVGRYFAMDRDQRWERTLLAYDALVSGMGEQAPIQSLSGAIDGRYASETDEFFKPIITESEGCINDGDTVIFFNFRSDRMRQIVSVLGAAEHDPLPFEPKKRIKKINIACMTCYNAEFPFPVISPPQKLNNVLAEWLSKQNLTQFHTAETEKYAHVTFFFNGGREVQFEGEDRFLVPSPKVATYDLKPEMSISQVAQSVIGALSKDKYQLVMCNFAPPDMVGHTGKFEPTVRAVEATDSAIGQVYDACQKYGYILMITADHGNAEKMRTSDGQEHTAHTCEKVPLICTAPIKFALPSDRSAALCDVAPTILALSGLPIPPEMTGRSLI